MSDPVKPTPSIASSRHRAAELIVVAAGLALLVGFTTIEGKVSIPLPPDFAELPPDEKKREFFDYLSPIVSEANSQAAGDRDRVASLLAANARSQRLSFADRRWLKRLAFQLEVDLESMTFVEALETLYRRTGVVPESLALVQAAVESGWGTSRFAIEGNNYFGQRCYRIDCGIVPEDRPEDQIFGLAEFASPVHAVESYILNLNTHESYAEFRDLRHQLRTAGEPVTGLAVVEGLTNYSERGDEYVEQIAEMIESNDLE